MTWHRSDQIKSMHPDQAKIDDNNAVLVDRHWPALQLGKLRKERPRVNELWKIESPPPPPQKKPAVLNVKTKIMGLVRITSWYPNFNGGHFGLPPSEIHRMPGLPPKIVWTMTYSHGPHWKPSGALPQTSWGAYILPLSPPKSRLKTI